MPRLHENTQFDPDKTAHGLVAELEQEALDEDQVAVGLEHVINILRSRQEVSMQLIQQETAQRIADRRRERVKAKLKGVKPVMPGPALVVDAGSVIPSRAH